MLALLDRVTQRTIAEAGRLAQQNDVATIDDLLVSVQAGEDSTFDVDATFKLRRETFRRALRLRKERVPNRIKFCILVGGKRVYRRAVPAAAAQEEGGK